MRCTRKRKGHRVQGLLNSRLPLEKDLVLHGNGSATCQGSKSQLWSWGESQMRKPTTVGLKDAHCSSG
eukprot:1065640-Amphidinium_carterae.1